MSGLCERFKSYITVEPVMILYLLTVVSSVGLFNFEFEKACAADLKIDVKICDLFHQFEENGIDCNVEAGNETQGQNETIGIICDAYKRSGEEIVLLNSYRSIITGVVQVIILLFAGGWSDKVGRRKPLILIPMIADFFKYIVLIISSIFMVQVPLWVPGILGDVIVSASGGFSVLIIGIYTYVTLCSSTEDRTFRLGFVGVVSVAVPIAMSFTSGPMYKALGITNLLLLCIIINFIAILYGIFFLKEPKDMSGYTGNEEEVQKISKTHCKKITEFFDPKLVIDCFRTLFKKRSKNVRLILMLTVVVYFVNFGAAGDAISAMIIAKLRFNWVSQLGYWASYDIATTLIGTLIAIGLLSKILKISDPLICVLSVVCTIISKPVMIYAVNAIKPMLYFVATTIDIFDGSKNIAIKSIISKLVGGEEIAKMFAILGVVESAQAIVYPSWYSILFMKTYESNIGAVFLLSGAFLFISLVLYIVLYFLSKTNAKSNDEPEAIGNEDSKTPSNVNSSLEMTVTHL